MMVDWAEICMQQSSLDKFDALVKKTTGKPRNSLPQKRSCFFFTEKEVLIHMFLQT
jgi:hypothetical protein